MENTNCSDEEYEPAPKKQKSDISSTCIICNTKETVTQLVKPNDISSWHALLEAAKLHSFAPILSYSSQQEVPDVFYHRRCRSSFTHKKTLQKLSSPTQVDASSPSALKRKLPREPSESRVYETKCIFCDKVSKYKKGTKTREPLVQSCELRADDRVRSAAIEKGDTRIISITARELVAAEAHYHRSCYVKYTKPRGILQSEHEVNIIAHPEDIKYSQAENSAYTQLFEHIRVNIMTQPQVATMVELTEKLVSFMSSQGMTRVQDHTKKHIRRKLEAEFGESLHIFPGEKGRLLVVPDNLTMEMLATEYMKVKKELHLYQNEHSKISVTLKKAAMHLRSEIQKMQIDQTWPPQPEELDQNYITLPGDLTDFVQYLLREDRINRAPSARLQTLVWSFSQDVVYCVKGGALLTTKHILLPWAVKTLTGNVELIKMLNRLGHGISYSKLMEIDTALCLQKLATEEEDGVALPTNVFQSIPTVLAYDNIDRQEETLSGKGTSHRVNGIVVQSQDAVANPSRPKPEIQKEKKRSITPTLPILPDYIAGQRCGPSVITPLPVATEQEAKLAQSKNLIWALVRQQDTHIQKVCSWTGFNIMTRDHLSISQDTVNYLPTINAPATALSTVYEVLNQALKIMDILNLPEIVCVFDQAMYAKATEIVWKQSDRFQPIILRLGVFHTICNLLAIIGKRFGDAGLRDLAVESGVIAEGSITSVLEGRQYNRGVRLHKLVYEALLRVTWKGFYPWLEEHYIDDVQQLPMVKQCLGELQDKPCHEALDSVVNSEACTQILERFTEYLTLLRNNSGDLAALWMSYIDLVDILLGLIRASREGNWLLHLHSIHLLIPWCFAYDRQNYARFLPFYYAMMTKLSEDHPAIFEYFQNGGFSVQNGTKNPFGRIPVDQTVEETVNKDTQTAGGTRGFSLKSGPVARYYLTAEYRSTSLRQLRDIIDLQSSSVGHADLEPSRISRDERDVQAITEILESQWTNPFSSNPSDITSLSTGNVAPADVAQDLLEANERGRKAYEDFQQDRLGPERSIPFHERLPRLKLKTFSSLKEKKTTRTSNKQTMLKADHRLFGQMVLIATSRNLNMKEVLKHPLGPLPWSLANGDGTMKKTNKAALSRELEKNVAAAENIPSPSACIIDGMAVIQKMHGENRTFAQLSEEVSTRVQITGNQSQRIDVVFDVYRDVSIKSAERTHRGSNEGVVFTNIMPGHTIRQWRCLLSCAQSKTNLVQYLVDDWKRTEFRGKLNGKDVFVTAGEKCFKLTAHTSEEVPELQSAQEEADTRMLLHANHAAAQYDSVIIVADDTDVMILSVAFQHHIGCKLYIKCGTQTRTRLVDITKMAAALGDGTCGALLGMHAFTGCDTVSAFSGQGKLKALKLLQSSILFQDAFKDLGQRWHLSDDIFLVLQTFTCQMYSAKSQTTNVNDLRYHLFRAKKGEVESGQLPPCRGCLYLHSKRANYQAGVWQRSLENSPEVPHPHDGHGWALTNDGTLTIDWMTGPPAPDVVLELLSCKCRRVCKLPQCGCLVNGLKCSEACYLKDCTNMYTDEDENVQQEQDSSDDEI